jgi:hypothetical protein
MSMMVSKRRPVFCFSAAVCVFPILTFLLLVFMGRGGTQHQPGNVKFRSLVVDKRVAYKIAPKGAKKVCAHAA